MNPDQIIFKAKWITVRETSRGFQYCERKGKDSIAVFLIRKSNEASAEYEVLVRQQPLCIENENEAMNARLKLFPCPITGAIEAGELPEVAAVREAYEEAGYPVQVIALGQYIVGTQTNEICYLYYSDVTGITPDEAQQDGSYFESISQNQWHPLDYLKSCNYSACQIGYFKLRELLRSP